MWTNNGNSNFEPFFFRASGELNKPLFGCYHPPHGNVARDCCVVLCYPLGREYIRSHRTYRQLAVLLAEAGFPVLRFDFYGCGDSGGGWEDAQIPQWLEDISSAIDEIRGRVNTQRVCLFGLRLGGALAMQAGAARRDIESVVLWNPVVSGKAYLQELTALHRKILGAVPASSGPAGSEDRFTEIAGFRLSDSLMRGLGALDLLAVEQPPAKNVLVIEGSKPAGGMQLAHHLKLLGPLVNYQHLPSPEVWTDLGRALVPASILQAAVSWISRVC